MLKTFEQNIPVNFVNTKKENELTINGHHLQQTNIVNFLLHLSLYATMHVIAL